MISELAKDLIANVMRYGSMSDVTALSDLIQRMYRIEKSRDECIAMGERVETQLRITSQDRDARRRRMELAQLILNYEQELPIEDLWNVANGLMVAIDKQQYADWNAKVNGWNTHPNYGQPRSFGTSTMPNQQCPSNPALPHNHQPDPTATPTIPHGECAQCHVITVYWNEPGPQHMPTCPLYKGPPPIHLHGGCDGNHGGERCDDKNCWIRCQSMCDGMQCDLTKDHNHGVFKKHRTHSGMEWD